MSHCDWICVYNYDYPNHTGVGALLLSLRVLQLKGAKGGRKQGESAVIRLVNEARAGVEIKVYKHSLQSCLNIEVPMLHKYNYTRTYRYISTHQNLVMVVL